MSCEKKGGGQVSRLWAQQNLIRPVATFLPDSKKLGFSLETHRVIKPRVEEVQIKQEVKEKEVVIYSSAAD